MRKCTREWYALRAPAAAAAPAARRLKRADTLQLPDLLGGTAPQPHFFDPAQPNPTQLPPISQRRQGRSGSGPVRVALGRLRFASGGGMFDCSMQFCCWVYPVRSTPPPLPYTI
jgi:hypothetical protein